MAAGKRRQDEKHLKILREFGSQPHNKQCFDCHQRGPTYINMTIGSFVCTSCSGILRGLNPPHRVKSISMTSFTPEEIEFIRSKGNEYCRRVWLGTYDSRSVVEPESKDEQRIKDFMIQKYERKRWYVDPSMVPRNQVLSPATPTTITMPTTPVPEVKPLSSLVNNSVKPLAIHQSNNQQLGILHNRTLPTSMSSPGLATSNQQQQQSLRPSLELLSEFVGDPFASMPNSASQPASNANFANFENFNSSVTSATRLSSLTASSSSLPSLLKPIAPPPQSTHLSASSTLSLKRHHRLNQRHSATASTLFSLPQPPDRNLARSRRSWQSFDSPPPSPPSRTSASSFHNNTTSAASCHDTVTQSQSSYSQNLSSNNNSDKNGSIGNSSAVLDMPTSSLSANHPSPSSFPVVNSDFSGAVSSPPSVGGTPMSTTSTSSQFGGGSTFPGNDAVTSPPASSTGDGVSVMQSGSSPASAGGAISVPAQDKYAALADLDNLFNSSTNANTNPEWEAKNNVWAVNGTSTTSYSGGAPPTSAAPSGYVAGDCGSPNPFSSSPQQQSWTPTHPPPTSFPPGNPFATGFNVPQVANNSLPGSYRQFNVAAPQSMISPPSSTSGGYLAVNDQFAGAMQNGGFSATPPGTNGMGWPTSGGGNTGMAMSGGWMGFNMQHQQQQQQPATFVSPAENMFTPTNKPLAVGGATQFHVWQPSVGNPFMANATAIPPRSSSSNPFL